MNEIEIVNKHIFLEFTVDRLKIRDDGKLFGRGENNSTVDRGESEREKVNNIKLFERGVRVKKSFAIAIFIQLIII